MFRVALAAICCVIVSCSAKSVNNRVIGGTEAEPNQFPFLVALDYNSGTFFCGGAIYDENHVITAAGCCESRPDRIVVIAGEHNLLYDDGTEQFRNATDLRQHEDYGGLGGSGNDVCVITLEEPLEFNDFVQPVVMPIQDQEFSVGSNATLPGWGSIDNLGPVPHFPTDLMFNDQMEIVGDEECAQMYEDNGMPFVVPSDEICAGRDGNSACYSDTGSPLICEGGVLCGIMSWDFDCDTDVAPSVFAEASHFADWFIENTQ